MLSIKMCNTGVREQNATLQQYSKVFTCEAAITYRQLTTTYTDTSITIHTPNKCPPVMTCWDAGLKWVSGACGKLNVPSRYMAEPLRFHNRDPRGSVT